MDLKLSWDAIEKKSLKESKKPTDDFDINDITITKEMKSVLDVIEDDKFKMMFITGKAGTGKSVFLKYLKRRVLKNAVFVAPTGIASINIQGQTIHSFFKFNHNFQSFKAQTIRDDKSVYQKMKYLIIDEISMVRADIFDSINTLLQINRNNHGEVFGGVKVIVFGDLFQLPPIVGNDDKRLFKKFNYTTPYFFSSNIFKELSSKVKYIEFSHIFRQKEMKFINILENVRHSKLPKDVNDSLNKRVIKKYNEVPDGSMILATINKTADEYNVNFLSNLDTEEKTYLAKIDGDFKVKDFPTKEILKLKVGAQVMFVKNDPMKRYVNGTIGEVTGLFDSEINVKLKSGTIIKVGTTEWEKQEYVGNKKSDDIKSVAVGRFTQIPVKLGWSISVHKSQGLTFDSVLLDTSNRVFAPGQIYVALSRCRTYEGLYLRYPIRKDDLIVNEYISAFLEYISNMKMEVKQDV